MHTIKIFSLLLVFLSIVACESEGGDSVKENTNNNTQIFEEVFVDDSVSNELLNRVNTLLSKQALDKSVDALIEEFSGVEPLKKFKKELSNQQLAALAVWVTNNKLMVSLLLKNEWHLALSLDELNDNKIKVIEITAIDPSAGLE